MKFVLVLIFSGVATHALNDEGLWEKFKRDYGKTYKNEEEEQKRFSIFQTNVKTIEEHNTEYFNRKITYLLRINQFADLTDQEFLENYLRHTQSFSSSQGSIYHQDQHFLEEEALPPVPDAIDWRSNGSVSGVEDQGSCGGGGWAFSVAGALEAQNIIQHNISLRLSSQQFIDCTLLNKGCAGGDVITALAYFLNETLYTRESYTHNGTNGTCGVGESSGVLIHEVFMVIPQEENLRNVVGTRGPVIVGINAVDLRFYGGGIYNNPNCSSDVNHKVLAIGYDTRDGLDYWIIKNSWGTGWGEDGYIYMTRNHGKQCGIGSESNIPLIR